MSEIALLLAASAELHHLETQRPLLLLQLTLETDQQVRVTLLSPLQESELGLARVDGRALKEVDFIRLSPCPGENVPQTELNQHNNTTTQQHNTTTTTAI